ncbi:hypothetical protein SARC_17139, partial [Sphaeroforma arctica JP610]
MGNVDHGSFGDAALCVELRKQASADVLAGNGGQQRHNILCTCKQKEKQSYTSVCQ